MPPGTTPNDSYFFTPWLICQSCSNPTIKFCPIPRELPSESQIHRHNILLNRAQCDTVISRIKMADQETAHIDLEITRLEETIATLKNRKVELVKFKCYQRSFIAPIRILPTDVLSYLFITCQNELDGGKFTDTSVILKLGLVSSYWRSIAQSTPQLWSRIHLSNTVAGMSKLAKCIEFSREAPLSIYFSRFSPERIFDTADYRTFAASAYRWAHLHGILPRLLQVVSSGLTNDGFTLLKTLSLDLSCTYSSNVIPPMPNLTHLMLSAPVQVEYTRFTFSERLFSTLRSGVTVSFQSIPSLTHFELRNVLSSHAILPDFPWAQVTHFTSESYVKYEEGGLQHVIQMMRNLVSLTIRSQCDGYGELSNRLLLPHLETLQLQTLFGKNASTLLPLLTAPRLRMLGVNGLSHFDAILEFIRRSGCEITELLIVDIRFDERWKNYQFRNVRKLTFNIYDKNKNDLLWLNRWNQEKPYVRGGVDFLPQLDTLDIQGVAGIDKVQALITAVKSRIPGEHKRKSLSDEAFLVEVNVEFYERAKHWKEIEMWEKFTKENKIRSSHAPWY